MYEVSHYKDRNGRSPIKDYIDRLNNLAAKGDKDSHIKAGQIAAHIVRLERLGHRIREPYAKNLGNGLWELRPIRDRILYAAWENNSFILLHIFKKDTQKTPKREIEQAKRNLADIRERRLGDE